MFEYVKGWFLVYIAIERFACVRYPNRFMSLRKLSMQIKITIGIFLLNFIYYTPRIVFFDLQIETNNTFCCIDELYPLQTVFIMDIINNAILPFIFMFLFTLAMIWSLYKARARVSPTIDKICSTRDVKFSLTTIFLNLSFFIMKFPFTIANYLYHKSKFEHHNLKDDNVNPILKLMLGITATMSVCVYSMSIFVYLTFNQAFRTEFMALFKPRQQKNKSISVENTST